MAKLQNLPKNIENSFEEKWYELQHTTVPPNAPRLQLLHNFNSLLEIHESNMTEY